MKEITSMKDVETSEYVVRFSFWARFQHAAIILLFGLLLLTGMPQKWPYAEASRWVIEHLGGIFVTRWLHRAAGIAFSVFLVVHLAIAITGVLTRRMAPSMLLSRRDFHDAIDNLRYYVGYAETPPPFGRFDYRQKFEYWGLVLGAAGIDVKVFFLACVVVAGVFGGATVNRNILFVQAVPGIIALALLLAT